jgi:hypothetical protein
MEKTIHALKVLSFFVGMGVFMLSFGQFVFNGSMPGLAIGIVSGIVTLKSIIYILKTANE